MYIISCFSTWLLNTLRKCSGKYLRPGVLTLLLLLAFQSLVIGAVTIGTSTSSIPTRDSPQRKVFRANTGEYWAFYYDGTSTVYEYSTNSTSWTNPKVALINLEIAPSVWINRDIIYGIGYYNYNIYSKKGTISTGTITWGVNSLVFDGTSTSNTYSFPFICQDSAGYLYAVATYYDGTNYWVRAKRSINPDDISTWGTTTTLSSTSTSTLYTLSIVVPYGTGNAYAIWNRNGNIEGKRYVASGWDGTVTSIAACCKHPAQSHSAVVDSSGNIHLVYIAASPQKTQYRRGTPTTNSWSSPISVADSAIAKHPTISINQANNDLYTLWTKDNQINCKSSVDGGSSWSPIPMDVETTQKNDLTSNYSSSNAICWIWGQGTSPPYSVMFDKIVLATDTLSYIIVTPGSRTLAIGGTQSFTAQGFDQHHNLIPGLSFDWTTGIGSLTVGVWQPDIV